MLLSYVENQYHEQLFEHGHRYAGSGFNELAGYSFGGNERKLKMEMTTPVLSTAGQKGSTPWMAFPMESKYNSMDALPTPSDGRVARKVQDSSVVAALTFGGWPLDHEVRSH